MKWKLFIICMSAIGSIHAQTAIDSVKNPIIHLFKAMSIGDTSLLRSCFTEKPVMQTISSRKDGSVQVRDENLQQFIESVASQPIGSLDEQIQFESVLIDGNLASVWTPYSFYFNKKFSHCGVNSFQLVRIGQGWKIQYIIDTRRKQGCQN